MPRRRPLRPLTWAIAIASTTAIVLVFALRPSSRSTAAAAGPRPRAAGSPSAAPVSATAIAGVFPSASVLPANLLRFSIEFSAPMSRGRAYEHVRLVDSANREVDRAFLILDEELWDHARTRFTLLFDPGRLKRTLRANVELGTPLREGRRYRLTIDREWPDATGRALAGRVEKSFSVGPADRAKPRVADWRVDSPPAALSRDPLRVSFPEPLDRALLLSSLTIVDARGARIAGRVTLGAEERSWRLTPDQPWSSGAYRVRVDPRLEDLAGNNLTRVFDVDRTADEREAAPQTERPFAIAPRRAPATSP